MLNLTNNEKEIVCEIAKQSFSKPIEIWAYGSRVNGDSHDGSDLDLVIRSNNLEKLKIDEYLDFKEKIKESNIPILVDCFDWSRLPDSFHSNILSNYEVLYSKK